MKHIRCSGTAYEIGLKHGRTAKEEVRRSVGFYESLFQQNVGYSWPEVRDVATKFLPFLQKSFPDYVNEMKGVAEGAGVMFDTILAMNARTEIAYGIVNDGCTALAVRTQEHTFLGQNWDWKSGQSPNMLTLHIEQPGKPTIHMITEAGIIGKIGLNSYGVGVTLNAVGAKGIHFGKIPCHLALRTVLNCTSREAAEKTLRKFGVASACHITIADANTGAIGIECTAFDMVEIPMDANGVCAHSNHMIRSHEVEGISLVVDSQFRLQRIQELIRNVGVLTLESFACIFMDEENYPGAINRAFSVNDPTGSETLFSVAMDLNQGFGQVKTGRPTSDGEVFELKP
ncbi:uncharacterized protein Z518_03124 [Rhinocladiella mackenziei CBS 650.93]|uniref:Peptidase C45 hydrolase domain-containing protein n=1 Tax=Rhinocladiella mackenziei CBS 650.93 TaxID=1442369 RepID=A0A0D2HDB0_9EURO|nr:uncharacterized protein Z518_03124 [Rhinocladiella mackenziei CBS 650.93]KIX08468.1 hypothetical protein Z518_03124 [Rhinocladiella mackenziei CBS 650.93]